MIRAAVGTAPVVAITFARGQAHVGAVRAGDLADATDMTPLEARLPFGDATVPAVLVSFVGAAPPSAARMQLLADVRRVLAPGGTACVLDHNRPRRRPAAWRAVAAPPAPRGWTPRARWRRLAYPTARETQAAGLVVEALRLAGAERVQIVLARKPGAAGASP